MIAFWTFDRHVHITVVLAIASAQLLGGRGGQKTGGLVGSTES
jgi:hypothetical protein